MIFFFITICFSTNAQINTYVINQVLTSPGQVTFDIDSNGTSDFTFDIITLSPGVLAARVDALGSSKILDNSTFGYPDTLNYNDSVSGYFHNGIGVLGTFNNAGQFNGAGNKYLGVKINAGNYDFIGWVELNCSINRDTLQIISCGYNSISNSSILAGQTTLVGINNFLSVYNNVTFFPNPTTDSITINSLDKINSIEIYNSFGEKIFSAINLNHIDLSTQSKGIYFVKIYSGEKIYSKKIILQ